MGDIIINVFGLVDKRLNRLKGLKANTFQDYESLLSQYRKIVEILNNAKRLLKKDPDDQNVISTNLSQLNIRLELVEKEVAFIKNKIDKQEFDNTVETTIFSPANSQSPILFPSSTSPTSSPITTSPTIFSTTLTTTTITPPQTPLQQSTSSGGDQSPIFTSNIIKNDTQIDPLVNQILESNNNNNKSTTTTTNTSSESNNSNQQNTPPLKPFVDDASIIKNNNNSNNNTNNNNNNNNNNNGSFSPNIKKSTKNQAVPHHNVSNNKPPSPQLSSTVSNKAHIVIDKPTGKQQQQTQKEDSNLTVKQKSEKITQMLREQHYLGNKAPSSYNPNEITFSYKEEMLKNILNNTDLNNIVEEEEEEVKEKEKEDSFSLSPQLPSKKTTNSSSSPSSPSSTPTSPQHSTITISKEKVNSPKAQLDTNAPQKTFVEPLQLSDLITTTTTTTTPTTPPTTPPPPTATTATANPTAIEIEKISSPIQVEQVEKVTKEESKVIIDNQFKGTEDIKIKVIKEEDIQQVILKSTNDSDNSMLKYEETTTTTTTTTTKRLISSSPLSLSTSSLINNVEDINSNNNNNNNNNNSNIINNNNNNNSNNNNNNTSTPIVLNKTMISKIQKEETSNGIINNNSNNNKLSQSLSASSLVDTFLLRHRFGTSTESLSISQSIQPYFSSESLISSSLPNSANNILSNSFNSLSSSNNSNASNASNNSSGGGNTSITIGGFKSSQQKISQKLKLAKQNPIRKQSDTKIGHARSNSNNIIRRSDYDLNNSNSSNNSNNNNNISTSLGSLSFSNNNIPFNSNNSNSNNNNNNLSVNDSGESTSSSPYSQTSSSPQTYANNNNSNSNNNSNNNNNNLNQNVTSEILINSNSSNKSNSNNSINSDYNRNNNNNKLIGQGERLALLQSLLKSEELTNNAESKVIDEINKITRQKSQELYQLVWEVRHLDKSIAHILNNRLQISDISDIGLFPDPLKENDNSNNNNNNNKPLSNLNNSNNKNSTSSPTLSSSSTQSSNIAKTTKASSSSSSTDQSTVIELSRELKFTLERLVVLLRTEPSILRDTLNRAGYLGSDMDSSFKSSHTDLSQAIVFSLFGNCFTAIDEKLLLLTIKSITEIEFRISSDKRNFGIHEPFSFTLLSTYLNYTYGKPYMISVLKDLVVSIIQDHNLNLENDPQKKAMLASIGIVDDDDDDSGLPVIDQQILLQQFSGEFLRRVCALSSSIPYALRWISKVVIELWRQHVKQQRKPDFVPSEISKVRDKQEEREFVIRLIFENFFIPAIIRPDHYGVLSGLTISQKSRHNLIQIAKMVLDFLRNPSTIPKWLNHHEGMELEQILDEYFIDLITVEEPEHYYHRPIFELELGQSLLVSSTDLFIILELIYHNRPNNISDTNQLTNDQLLFSNSTIDSNTTTTTTAAAAANDYFNHEEEISLQNEVVEMIKTVQPASQLQEGMKFLVINVVSKKQASTINGDNSKIFQTASAHSLKLAKANLTLALSVLNFICGYSQSTNICELLLMQCGRNRSMELNILEAQIEETIRSLWALPETQKQDDYKSLLDTMFDDFYKRDKKRNLEKQLKVLYLDQLQRHSAQIAAQKKINIEFLTHQKFRQFRDKTYARLQTEFVGSFMSRFNNDTGYCSCVPTLDSSIICSTCSEKSKTIKSFIQRAKNEMTNSPWWNMSNTTDDEFSIATNTLERNLLTQIYNFTFNISKEDLTFSKDLISKFSSIDHGLLIAEKYSSQAPWELAQQEIKKINLYKSPQDKMKCIIDTWNIIFNYTKPFGSSGPDDFLPIMGYVIIKARPENILSNIQYIELYSELNDDSEIWFMNLKSSIEIVKEVLKDAKNKGWRKGIVSSTTQRMENMRKEIKKKEKEKLKSYRMSIVNLETNSVGTPTSPPKL
ncbi:hypothetical protein ACTFIR_002844 [Dictyostelium discoideum]